MAEWRVEYQKCKEDEAYFFKNYCLVNGKRPTEYTVKLFKQYVEYVKDTRVSYKRRARYNPTYYLTHIREYPLKPEDAFVQLNLLEDGPENR